MSKISLTLDNPELAHHYEKISADRQFKFGRRLIDDLGVSLGERVLDVGAGTGLLAEYVSTVVGPLGVVVGVDPLPLRIELARQKIQRNLRFEVGDAHDLSVFPAESFDVVYLNAVFHWLTDKPRALTQFYRVLKKGGRLGIATGAKDDPAHVQTVKSEILSRPPYNQYPQGQAGTSSPVSADELKSLLTTVGFTLKTFEIRPKVNYFPTPAGVIDFSQASSFGNLLGHLPENLRDAARSEIEAGLEKFRTPEGIAQGGSNLVAVAIKS